MRFDDVENPMVVGRYKEGHGLFTDEREYRENVCECARCGTEVHTDIEDAFYVEDGSVICADWNCYIYYCLENGLEPTEAIDEGIDYSDILEELSFMGRDLKKHKEKAVAANNDFLNR